MCGISGIVNHNNSKVDVSVIEEMNRMIQHRGPDGTGTYFGSNFAFGHQRLSILDLSEDGKQPMIYNSNLVITYNGEIYNYIELREELIQKNYRFETTSDTEVIVHLITENLKGESNLDVIQGFIPHHYRTTDLGFEFTESLNYNTPRGLMKSAKGNNFSIVELNGAASEPTHIYDPKHSLFFAWKELARHIGYMYRISAANHKRGIPYLSHKVGMEQYRLHLEQSKKIVNF